MVRRMSINLNENFKIYYVKATAILTTVLSLVHFRVSGWVDNSNSRAVRLAISPLNSLSQSNEKTAFSSIFSLFSADTVVD